jgi:hypothetical protein
VVNITSLPSTVYNTYYDTILYRSNKSYLKDLLELPDSISGYYLDINLNEIAITDGRHQDDRFAINVLYPQVAHSHPQTHNTHSHTHSLQI